MNFAPKQNHIYYYPLANVTLQSPLNDEQVAGRISQNLEPQKMRYNHWLLHPEKTSIFEGLIFGSRFKMKRIAGQSSLCNPSIKGHIKQEVYNKSSITMEFRITGMNAALLFLIMVFLSIGGLGGVSTILSGGRYMDVALWFGVYALILWRFNTILNKNIVDLCRVLEARPEVFNNHITIDQ